MRGTNAIHGCFYFIVLRRIMTMHMRNAQLASRLNIAQNTPAGRVKCETIAEALRPT